ncbi:MAG TPA: hypothetical protein VGV57_07285 [Thermoleophilaceae bacterium]|nr:hypothetical protein [Thermoleophilaceae bacterium]
MQKVQTHWARRATTHRRVDDPPNREYGVEYTGGTPQKPASCSAGETQSTLLEVAYPVAPKVTE